MYLDFTGEFEEFSTLGLYSSTWTMAQINELAF